MTQANKYLAQVPFKLGEKELTLEYDWRAVSELYSAFGPQCLRGLTLRAPDEIALFIHAGLKKNHPEITVDDVLNAQLPFLSVFEPIERGILFFFYGAEGPPADAAGDEDEPTGAKKN